MLIFQPVLWDLIQKEDNSSALRFLIRVGLKCWYTSLSEMT